MRKPSSPCTASKITPCCSKVGIKRGPWTPEEDEILANFVRREGEGQWRTLPKRAGLLRCGKSCRLRWMNYLRPSVKRGRIAPDEEDLILRLHRLLGNRWSLIAGRIPGRTDNEIKNYWNTHLSKKLINQGIDPRTHKPLNPNFNSSEAVANGSTTGNYTAVAYSNPNPNPKPDSISNPNNHNSSGSKETNPDDRSQDRFQNLVADRGSKNNNIIGDGFVSKNMGLESCSHGNGNDNNIENYTTNEMEDTFSSFLDSLINDDNGGRFENDQEQVVQPNVVAPFLHELPPAAPSFNISEGWDYGGLWGAELRYAMDTLGDEDHQKQSNVYNNTYNCNFWS